ncbi:MAG: FtsW/RodA/SpoVE family cell cycle protein, partial [Anaerolineae bacterium]|nr:FtsW/RodA/SpoVE family cell cycle protein [Anaerolineae bacterium]
GLLTIWRLDEGYGQRQTLWLVFSLAVCHLLLHHHDILSVLRRYKYVWLVSGLILTSLTFFMGTYPGGDGPHLWLGWHGFYLQPSEPLKLLLIVYLAAYLAGQIPTSFNLLRSIVPSFLLVLISLGILVAQRDLGTASIFILIYFIILYLATAKRRVLLISFVVMLLAAVLGYQLFSVIRFRIDSWINPWVDPSGKSYQIIQSLLAVAAGGMLGRGIGLGNPSLVPVAQSDYIFAAIAEETGLIGVIVLVVLFALLAGRGILLALRAPTHYKRYLSVGITTYFIVQTLLIVCGNLRILPLTGVTLPLVSYGGSSLLTSMISILLLILISTDVEEEPSPLSSPIPFLLTSAGMLAGLFIVGLVSGYWAVFRADQLLARTDNPRRAIDDLYVKRGSLLDRDDHAIAYTSGIPGSYTRNMLIPALGPVVGYTDATYGQAGLEASLDGYLRGLQANSGLDIWYNHLVYGQPPPGSDIRLSLDIDLQNQADQLLGDHNGAIVLMNAQNGEILAMASHPYFDPNGLNDNWENWIIDPNYPLVNRAAQIDYPTGTALGPILYANAINNATLPEAPEDISIKYQIGNKSHSWLCAFSIDQTTWREQLSKGCPAAVETLLNSTSLADMQNLIVKTGLDQAPRLPLLVAPTANQITKPLSLTDQNQVLSASPLQMALVASILSSQGNLPSPSITLSINTRDQGRVIFTPPVSQQVFLPQIAQRVTRALAVSNLPLWQTTANAYQGNDSFTWYLGGTLPSWSGTPLAIVVVLEEDNAPLAQQIGLTMLKDIIQPAEK